MNSGQPLRPGDERDLDIAMETKRRARGCGVCTFLCVSNSACETCSQQLDVTSATQIESLESFQFAGNHLEQERNIQLTSPSQCMYVLFSTMKVFPFLPLCQQ